ncbi:MAG TPA: biotin--[acetyl-CoA-carboxylase] ligase [Segeticoccus sp.]|nr:biotin--[acetyl-CoA-carboxylase] ligase [Segeticoccus sp.]
MRESVAVPALRAALPADAPWRPEVHESVGSTNVEALRDPRPWRVVVAEHQSAGKGRMQRRWEAPPRSSLAISVVLPVEGAAPRLGWIPLITGMTIRTTAAQLTSRCPAGAAGPEAEPLGDRVALKWPNDVLAREQPAGDDTAGAGARWRKLCGVLCELAPSGEVVVCGAGLNVDLSSEELPVPGATSLTLCGVEHPSREALVAGFLQHLGDAHRAWQAGGGALEGVRTAYRRSCLTIGQPVRVHRPGRDPVEGRAVAVDDEGRLVVDGPGGRQALAAGDVEHVRAAEAT